MLQFKIIVHTDICNNVACNRFSHSKTEKGKHLLSETLTLFIVFNQLSFIVTVFFIISFAGDVEMDNSAENSEQFEDADK